MQVFGHPKYIKRLYSKIEYNKSLLQQLKNAILNILRLNAANEDIKEDNKKLSQEAAVKF